ncbi:MAG: iron-sulfur cluster assembly accessory protein [Gammaproteobacteria bacterium]|nr:iron-sulfur cluster assembly accessory protein [Gammaproteobacteria bacterium]
MITITPAAAAQIQTSALQGGTQGMALRIAAKRDSAGAIQYAMGFDDTSHREDTRFNTAGIDLVVAATSTMLLEGTTLDYVELEPGHFDFIFMNPNDPNYRPPQEDRQDNA